MANTRYVFSDFSKININKQEIHHFAKVSKNLTKYRFENMLDHLNNYIRQVGLVEY